MAWIVRLALLCVLWGASSAAHAQDRFEIQVYDTQTAEPGSAGVEMHTNHVVRGSRSYSPEGEWPTHDVSHVTLEPHLGITNWFEVGAYLQTSLHPGLQLRPAGVKLRAKVRAPFKLLGVVGFALNGEFSAVPEAYERDMLGVELRPVIDVETHLLYFSVNPILTFSVKGAEAFVPTLEPAATLMARLGENVMVGVEYYGVWGPVVAPPDLRDQVHQLWAVVTLANGPVGIHLGAGHGFLEGDRWMVKSILSADLGN